MTELNLAGNDMGIDSPGKFAKSDMSGVTALADVIPDMGALTSLDVSSNNLTRSLKANRWAGESFAADWGEKDEHWETDMTGIIALANAIPDMGAISTFTFGDKQAVTMTAEMTEANFSGKLFSSEAQIVAAFLPKCT
jgi:hypothetical protein